MNLAHFYQPIPDDMLFKNSLVFLLFMMLFQLSTAQNWVMIRGGIFDIQGKALSGANIKNKNRLYGTYTDREGQYSIIMATADTLEVSMVGFKSFKKQIPRFLESTSHQLNIMLMPDTIFLKTAEITPYPLTYESLRQEFISTPSVEEKYFSRLQTPPVTGPLIIGGPISFLYNKYSKEARELRKMEAIYNNIAMRNRFLQVISPEVLSIRFGCYSDEEVDDLLKFCGISPHWFNSVSAMQIAERIQTCGEAWKKQQIKKSP